MDDLDLIKQKINIVDLIQEYLPLKKSGVNFKAPCPFHQEKTPSFMVSPERGIWHCFGCQKGGDIFKFLMEREGIDFPEALETLAKRAGVALKKRANSGEKDRRQRLYEANQKAAQFYNHILTKHKLGEKALAYLHSRGVSDQTIKELNLGYAPNSWESLTGFLKKRNFTTGEIVEAGLGVASQRGCYDRFRGRVVFPLTDLKGQTVGFSGRILDKGEPKYLNTPQTPIFNKGHFLYGLNWAKGEIRIKNQVVLVEGMMDAVMSYQAGVKNVVATQGTALTSDQIELLKKYTENLALCFDMDMAGDNASRRGIEMADAAGLNIKVVELKDGKDAAEVVLKEVKVWQEAVEKAEPIYDYYFRSVMLRYNPKTAEGKKKIAAELLPVISKISDNFTKEHYLQKLAALIAASEELLRREINRPYNIQTPRVADLEAPSPKFNLSPKSRQGLLEEYLLTLLLKIPQDLTFVPTFPETLFLSEIHRSLYVLLVLYLDSISFKSSVFNIDDFAKTLPEELVVLADRLYLREIDDKLYSSRTWEKEIDTVVSEIKKGLIKASLEKLSAEIKTAQAFDKIELLETLNRRFRDLSLKLKNL